MPVPTYNPDLTDETYERLLGQFQDKPIIQAILKTWTDKVQEIENDLNDLMTKTLFLNAEGENLQRYGSLFGILRPEGISDGAYRELLVAEILKRSSDGTPDRIRQILEATTGMSGMRIFEHINESQLPTVTMSTLAYGYADPSISDFTLDGNEGSFLRQASPISTGSVIIGQHLFGEATLFIPSELPTPLEKLHVDLIGNPAVDPDILTTNNDDFIAIQRGAFDQFGEGFENAVLPEFGKTQEKFQVDTDTGIEDFGVDTTLGVEEFQVDSISGIQLTGGIMLETAQLLITEDVT